MITPLLAVYLGLWMLTTTALLTAAATLSDPWSPPKPHSFALVSVIAGALWPVLLIGLAELGSAATYAKLHHP